jgi:carboxymethylenebutenolidase
MARITLPSGTAAELAVPSSGTPDRGLVLWPDVLGLRPLFDEHAQRLADDQNWAVCAVELFPGGEVSVEDRFAVTGSLSDADNVADAEAAAHAGGVSPVGLLGFCMGGMYAMKSLASPRFDRAVAFYGMIRMPEQWQGAGQGDAIDVVRTRSDDLLGIFGMKDPWCPPEQIEELEATGAHVVRYPEADHGWAQDPGRDNYRTDDAADAWARAIDFLTNGPS